MRIGSLLSSVVLQYLVIPLNGLETYLTAFSMKSIFSFLRNYIDKFQPK